MSTLARWAYIVLLTLGQPVYLLRLLWRARVEPLYGRHLAERWGFYPASLQAEPGGWIWLHAVSLGETRAAAALIDVLREQAPDMRLLLTHGTATGREAGRAFLRSGDVQVWLPCDLPGAVQRFLTRFKPAVGVLMETEVWPQLLHQAKRQGLPMLVANGRLSARSLRRGKRYRALLFPAARNLRLVMAQSEADAERFRQTGAPEVIVSGNLKFDMRPDESLLRRGREWRIGLGRPVILAASTREAEEAMLLAAWQVIFQRVAPGASAVPLLVIVPRHPQRFDEVARLVENSGLAFQRRSSWQNTPGSDAARADVWVGDSLGEMALYYSLADVALLGGSFAPLGGQNLIEAAACGCPVVMGPHTFNFAQAAEMALAAGVAWRVDDMGEALRQAVALSSSAAQSEVSAQAMKFAQLHRGAAARMARHTLALAGEPVIPEPRQPGVAD